MQEDEIVEEEVVLDSVYPRTSLSVTNVETYDSTSDGVTQTFYRVKYGTAFLFSKDYILPDEELHVVFESGDLNGMDFAVRFNPLGLAEKKDDGSFNPDAQMLEIVANEDYGRSLPDAVLHPAKTDKFSLYGWDSTKMEALGLLAAAEQELLTEGNKLLDEYRKDKQTYTCPMMWDWCKEQAEEGNTPRLGSVVTLHFVAGDTGRKSRIIGFEHDLDIEYSNVTYICGEKVSVSRLKTLESKVEGLTHDGTKVKVQNSLDFLSKRYSDRTPYQLSSDVGFEAGRYLAGVSGGMFGIDKTDGQSFADVFKLWVRGKAYFETLTIIEGATLAGKQYITPGGAIKCTKVEEVKNEAGAVTAYRCYFLSEQDGDKTETKIVAGDQAISEMFNAKVGTSNKVSNHRYWRLVTAVNNDAYTDEAGNHYGYIDLSKTDCESASNDAPQAGDVIDQLGNRTDKTRQAAMIFSTVDSDSPSIKLLTGIDHYTLAGKDIISQGYDPVKGHAYFNCYGDTFIGAKDGSTYVKYDQDTKQLDIKAKLNIASTIDGKTLNDYFTDLIPELSQEDIEDFVNNIVNPKLEGIQNQIDGVIETWFFNGVPTLTNYPANGWTTDALKAQHLGDLYYDNDTGTAYRFSQNPDGPFYWNVITDDAITKALAAAQRAQDTADGKRRVFTAQPTAQQEYDQGDLWVNATYGTQYNNDILRCVSHKDAGAPFKIEHWGLASNYTDDSALNTFIAGYQTTINDIKQQVDGKAETWYQATDPSSAWASDADKAKHVGDLWYCTADIAGTNFKKGTTWYWNGTAWEQQDVPESVFDAIDGKADIFVSKPASYNVNDLWFLESDYSLGDPLVTYKKGTLVVATASSKTFNAAHWTKKDRYTDDTLAQKAIDSIADYEYLRVAMVEGASQTIGGLFLTSYIKLGSWNKDNPDHPVFDTPWSGLNGVYVNGRTPSYFAGGDMVDRFDAQDNWLNEANKRYAASMIRMDGSAYFLDGDIQFRSDKTAIFGRDATAITIANGSVKLGNGILIDIGGESKGLGDSIASVATLANNLSNLFKPYSGNTPLTWDDVKNGATYDNVRTAAGLWSESFISARGQNPNGGGSAGASALAALSDVQLSSPAGGQALVYNGSKWVNHTLQTGLDESALATYLSQNGYAKQSWVSANFNKYMLPAATATTLGGVKIGSNISIDGNGAISTHAPYSLPTASASVKGGVKVGSGLTIASETLAVSLSASHIPSLDWSKITSGKPTTLAGYGITDGYTKTEADNKYLLKTSYTAADVLAKLKTVDGSGSGLDADLLDGLDAYSFVRQRACGWTANEDVAAWAKRYIVGSAPTIYNTDGWAWADSTYLKVGTYSLDLMRYSAIDFRRGNLNNAWQQKAILFLPTYSDTSMIYIAQMSSVNVAGTVTTSVKRYADYDTILSSNVASATKLADNTAFKAWGQTFFENGKPKTLSGNMTGVGSITASGEIRTTSANGFRIAYSNYGAFLRNDGANTYFLLTASGDQNGNWNSLRPFKINNATGLVEIGNGLSVNSITIGSCVISWDAAKGMLHFSKGLYSDEAVSARGANSSGGGGGGGTAYNRLDDWSAYATDKAGYVLSAKLGYDLHTRLNNVYTKGSVDSLLANKADKTQLANYYTKAEVDTKDKRLTTYYSSRPASANVNFGNNTGLYTFLATSSMTTGKPTVGDAHILHMEWDNSLSWAGQLALPTQGSMQWRYQSGTTWQAWRTLLDSGNTYLSGGVITINGASITPLTAHQTLDHINNLGNLAAVSGTTTMPSGLRLYSVYNNGYPTTYGNLLRVGGSGSGELLCGWTGAEGGTGRLYYRSKRDLAFTEWSAWGTVAYLTDLTWGNVTGKPTNFVTTDTTQAISGLKTFTNQLTIRDDTRGIIIYKNLRGKAGAIEITGANGAWAHNCLEFENNGNVTARNTIIASSFIRNGGTSSQFLKADGSVDSSSYLTTGTASSTYVKKSGDTMTGRLNLGSSMAHVFADGTFGAWLQYGSHYLNVKSDGLWHNNSYRIWDSGNDGSGSGLDADLLDGVHNGDLTAKLINGNNRISSTNITTPGFYYFDGNPANISDGSPTPAGSWNFSMMVLGNTAIRTKQLALEYSTGRVYTRINVEGWSGWKSVAFTTDNVASATKLQTARTLWGQSFDGTANVSGSLTGVGSIMASGLIKTSSAVKTASIGIECNTDGTTAGYGGEINRYGGALYLQHRNTGNLLMVCNGGNVGIGTTSPSYKLHVEGGNMRLSSSNTGAGGDVYAELWRGANASWRIINTGGILKFQSNYTTAVTSYFDCMTINYNTGNVYLKGELNVANRFVVTSGGGFGVGTTTPKNNYFQIKQRHMLFSYANLFFTMDQDGNGKGLYFASGENVTVNGTSKLCLPLYAHENLTWKKSTFRFFYDGTFWASDGIWSNGYVSARGQNTSSDARLKQVLRPVSLDFRDVAKAPSVLFRWREDGAEDVGSIAQYWQRLCPHLTPKGNDGYLTLQYGKAALLASIANSKEIVRVGDSLLLVARKTESLEKRVERLERENKELRRKLEIHNS